MKLELLRRTRELRTWSELKVLMAQCKSCGCQIPGGYPCCSMCYGDPHYGNDGLYMQHLAEEEALYYRDLEEQYREDCERVAIIMQIINLIQRRLTVLQEPSWT